MSHADPLPLMDREEIIAECTTCKRTSVKLKEKREIVEKGELFKPPSLQDVYEEMECSGAYTDVLPEMLKFIKNFFLFQLKL